MKKLIEFLIGLLIGALFAIVPIVAIIAIDIEQEKQIKKHCSHLTSYEYGACITQCYK